MKSRPWSPKEDKLLTDLWKQEIISMEIGHRLGRSDSSVKHRAHRLRLQTRKPYGGCSVDVRVRVTPEEHAALTRLSYRRKRSIAALVRQALVKDLGPLFGAVVEEERRR